MSRPDPSQPTDDQAVEWQVRLHSGRADSALRAAYDAWRRADPSHEGAACAAEDLWRAVGDTAAARAHRAARPQTHRALAAAALAAGLALLPVAGLVSPPADLSTGTGERRETTLPDGSVVAMNTATRLDIRFTPGERRIILREGEAVFQVLRDAARPFVVEAGDAEATAVGTVYDVRRDGDGVDVTVSEGLVRVAQRNGTESVLTAAGRKVRVSASGLEPVQSADPRTETAWRRGKLIVNGRPLGQVMAELSRHRRGAVAAIGEVRDMPVSAVLDLDDDDTLFSSLEQSFGVKVVRLPLLTIIHR